MTQSDYPLRMEYVGKIIEVLVAEPNYLNLRFVGIYRGEDHDFLKISPYVEIGKNQPPYQAIIDLQEYLKSKRDGVLTIKEAKQIGKRHIVSLEKMITNDVEEVSRVVIPQN